MSNVPVGARWRAETTTGEWAEYWLSKRENNLEVWCWTSSRTASLWEARTSDWGSNRSVVQHEASYSLKWGCGEKVRFKRVKP